MGSASLIAARDLAEQVIDGTLPYEEAWLELARAVLTLSDDLETAEKRLRHSEFHRTANSRRMRRLGKYQGVLEAKIIRQRQALRDYSKPRKRLSALQLASELHHSLRRQP